MSEEMNEDAGLFGMLEQGSESASDWLELNDLDWGAFCAADDDDAESLWN